MTKKNQHYKELYDLLDRYPAMYGEALLWFLGKIWLLVTTIFAFIQYLGANIIKHPSSYDIDEDLKPIGMTSAQLDYILDEALKDFENDSNDSNDSDNKLD